MSGYITSFYVIASVALASGATIASDNPIPDPRSTGALSSAEPPIKIIINPEARVSAVLSGRLPPPVPCGTAMVLPVKIVNQGYVTARLEVELVGSPIPGVEVTFESEPLKGLPEEVRNLRITLGERGPTDVTVAFRTHNVVPDLGGRNRIHFLMLCVVQ
jgi:hypothetical protein